jgi:hypothetical protein
MTVLYILLVCPNWQDIRREIGLTRQDISWMLTIREEASLAIKLILRTGLLEQFQHYASEIYGMRIQPAQEEEEERKKEEKEEREEEEEGERE